ncbi:MAG: OB-fold nucleic acid binding domain-containing protein [Thermodesulfobacteriota bacterium]|nr:OB-fold nucleic acid binding domain-containing protein [Thermodesulfobacteriota bacterium]
MKYTYCITAALAIALLFTGPALAEEKKTAVSAASSVSMDGKPIKGKVLETMDAAGYTYIQVDASEGKVWVAIPQSKIEVGQEVLANPGMVMKDFESKSLNKTFDVIIFSSGLGDPGKPFAPKKKAAMGGMGGSSFAAAMQAESGGAADPHTNMGGAMGGAAMAEPSGGSTTAIVPAAEVKVDKATADNAQTISECFDKAKELDNKKVTVRGKVMKVSRMIMGKNWLHLQDGTGNPMKNSHDLVVTTMAVPEKDSVVVIEGILHANKDFGAGYKYEVIIEDAEVK